MIKSRMEIVGLIDFGEKMERVIQDGLLEMKFVFVLNSWPLFFVDQWRYLLL